MILCVTNTVIANPTTILYVSKNATGLNNGTSWCNAYTSLQSALDVATSGYQIWVAAGTYNPTLEVGGTGSQYRTFQMKNGVAIYGGFSGTETAVSQRADFGISGANETILSGDLNGDDLVTGVGATLAFSNTSDNCYNVFYHPYELGLTSSSVLNGFTVKGGNTGTTYSSRAPYGGGFFNEGCSPTLTNINIVNNWATFGGGIFNNNSSSPSLTNVTLSKNICQNNGGGIGNEIDCSPILTNVILSDNLATGQGGGMHNYSNANPILNNVTVAFNTAIGEGGGISDISLSSPTLNNCIIWGNTAISGNQFYNLSGSLNLNYSCYQNNTGDLSNSGSFTATNNNITSDPQFKNSANGDFRIYVSSPCVDAGSDAYNTQSTDIRGGAYGRKLNKLNGLLGAIDMGPYEYNVILSPLAVNWLNFAAQKCDKQSLLTWTTSTEENNKAFLVQHSTDGITWTKIGVVNGGDNSYTFTGYSFTHATPVNNINYYRLLQIDLDGKSSFSKVVSVQFSGIASTIKAIKNPVNNGTLQLQLGNPTEVILFTNQGQVVLCSKLGAGIQSINVGPFLKGIYLLKTATQTLKILIE
jgi:hypothetical protein